MSRPAPRHRTRWWGVPACIPLLAGSASLLAQPLAEPLPEPGADATGAAQVAALGQTAGVPTPPGATASGDGLSSGRQTSNGQTSNGQASDGTVALPADEAALLAELQQVTVTSVSRRPENLQDAAAAVFVISAEDIRRSGARSVPEALRLSPGVEVAQLAGGRWSVSVRGFNGRFANKLLVLLDGRSIYTPLFAGVYWEGLNLPMDTIERIEVLRGPADALWGANAVNGVINIITRRARDTEGTRVTALAGSRDQGALTAEHTGILSDETRARLWAQTRSSPPSTYLDGSDRNDHPRDNSAGFRLDHQFSADAALQLTGGAGTHRSADSYPLPQFSMGPGTAVQNRENLDQFYLQGQLDLQKSPSQMDQWRASLAHDRIENTGVLTESRLTLDLGWQTQNTLSATQQLVFGLDYRLSRDSISTFSSLVQVNPGKGQQEQAGLFLRDTIALEPGRWQLSLGARVETSSYVSPQVLPDLRVLFTPSSRTSLWASIATATRTPVRGERDGTINAGVLAAGSPGNPFPAAVQVIAPGNRALGVENAQAIELGVRQGLTQELALDASVFTERYTNLLQSQLGNAIPTPGVLNGAPVLDYLLTRSTNMKAHSEGIETTLDWQAGTSTRLSLAETEFRLHAGVGTDLLSQIQIAALQGGSPRHRLSLRASHDLDAGQQVDGWLRYVSGLDAQGVPAYTTLDLRYGVAWSKNLRLSLFGQNLLAPKHPEFTTELVPLRNAAVPRVVGASADWRL